MHPIVIGVVVFIIWIVLSWKDIAVKWHLILKICDIPFYIEYCEVGVVKRA